MRPAGVAAIFGALAVQAGLITGGSALEGDGTAERLLEASTGDADSQLRLGVIISAAGFLALAIPLTHFFNAARARSERVLRPLIGMAVLGSVLIAGGLILNNVSYLEAADNFAASEAQREAQPAEGAGAAEPKDSTGDESAEDAEDEADDRADDALGDASGATASALLVRGGALLFAIGFLYTSLWCMRTGLLTRFWGSLGMASAVVLALFFLYFFSLVWFLAMGLLLLGAWFGGRPPAWEAGIAIPWPRPGDDAAEAAPESVEGHGRELSERPLPEDDGEGGYDAPGPDEPGGPPGEPPQKRKRRR